MCSRTSKRVTTSYIFPWCCSAVVFLYSNSPVRRSESRIGSVRVCSLAIRISVADGSIAVTDFMVLLRGMVLANDSANIPPSTSNVEILQSITITIRITETFGYKIVS